MVLACFGGHHCGKLSFSATFCDTKGIPFQVILVAMGIGIRVQAAFVYVPSGDFGS